MRLEEYFVIRPTKLALKYLAEIGIDSDDAELTGPIVWRQSFGRRIGNDKDYAEFVLATVKLHFLGWILSEIRNMTLDASISLAEFDLYWNVDWIGQNIVTAEGGEGDLVLEVLELLATQARQAKSEAVVDFEKLIVRVRRDSV